MMMIGMVLMRRPRGGRSPFQADPVSSRLFRRLSDRVVRAADGVLNFPGDAVDLAVGLQFGVADRLADRDFRCAFGLFDRSGDSILIHGNALPLSTSFEEGKSDMSG